MGGRARTIKARLSDEGYAGWAELAREIGVPISALVEAAGLLLNEGLRSPDLERLTELARQVAFERRRRDED